MTITPPPGSGQGPARPSHAGAGQFTLALTGDGAAEYPLVKGNTTIVVANGTCGGPMNFPAWAGEGSAHDFLLNDGNVRLDPGAYP